VPDQGYWSKNGNLSVDKENEEKQLMKKIKRELRSIERHQTTDLLSYLIISIFLKISDLESK
jgi:hypothetical protein